MDPHREHNPGPRSTRRFRYTWSYYPNGQPGTLPTEMGEVRNHIRADGWERLVAGIVTELADRRAAREHTDE